jgi:hypothetical protein
MCTATTPKTNDASAKAALIQGRRGSQRAAGGVNRAHGGHAVVTRAD